MCIRDRSSPGTRMHWNGSNWTQIDGDAPCTFLEVWGDSTERGWGRCRTGELQYWNGHAFVEIEDPAPGDPVEVAGTAQSAFAADGTGRVAHCDGRRWHPVDAPLTGRLDAVHGSSPADVWAVGDQVLHYDGCSWTAID